MLLEIDRMILVVDKQERESQSSHSKANIPGGFMVCFSANCNRNGPERMPSHWSAEDSAFTISKAVHHGSDAALACRKPLAVASDNTQRS